MTDFWLAAGLLLLAALAFLLLPVVRGRRAQREEDRTALNVALYQERLGELDTQRSAGVLSAEQFEAGRAEAARELLRDTEGSEDRRAAHLGRAVPLAVALLVPLLGYGLYLHWGASDKLELARQFAEQPRSLEEMVARLELAVQAQPDAAESWYFLGRAYMAQDRPADAAKAFGKAIDTAGRGPELLGQLAQALYFAGDKQWTDELQALTDEALAADPQEATSLGLLGIAAYEAGRFQEAIEHWQRLVAQLEPQDPARAAIQGGIERARQQLGEGAGQQEQAPAAAAAEVKVRVALDPAVASKVQPGDSVFVFARAVSGPPMPLAVKRLTVADLPAEIALSDADAMMPQLKLSNFDEVQLVARVSRAGNATAGEWIGRSEAVSTGAAQTAHSLSINQPDQP